MDVYQAPALLILLDLLFKILKVKFYILDVVVVLGPSQSKNLFKTVVDARLIIFSGMRRIHCLNLLRYCFLSFFFINIKLLLTSDELHVLQDNLFRDHFYV